MWSYHHLMIEQLPNAGTPHAFSLFQVVYTLLLAHSLPSETMISMEGASYGI